MSLLVKNSLRKPDPPRSFATVVSILPDGRYKVIDNRGKRSTVDGDTGYLPGQPVQIQNKAITKLAKTQKINKTIRV